MRRSGWGRGADGRVGEEGVEDAVERGDLVGLLVVEVGQARLSDNVDERDEGLWRGHVDEQERGEPGGAGRVERFLAPEDAVGDQDVAQVAVHRPAGLEELERGQRLEDVGVDGGRDGFGEPRRVRVGQRPGHGDGFRQRGWIWLSVGYAQRRGRTDLG